MRSDDEMQCTTAEGHLVPWDASQLPVRRNGQVLCTADPLYFEVPRHCILQPGICLMGSKIQQISGRARRQRRSQAWKRVVHVCFVCGSWYEWPVAWTARQPLNGSLWIDLTFWYFASACRQGALCGALYGAPCRQRRTGRRECVERQKALSSMYQTHLLTSCCSHHRKTVVHRARAIFGQRNHPVLSSQTRHSNNREDEHKKRTSSMEVYICKSCIILVPNTILQRPYFHVVYRLRSHAYSSAKFSIGGGTLPANLQERATSLAVSQWYIIIHMCASAHVMPCATLNFRCSC